ncbi:divalent cation transport protein [Staphylococcus gallinarum]|uniref:Divalent cation transport protein n=1 Tax=Staphylococcus gallinarum TaxID=1293 RepID=A0A380FGL0_STAGA|nr:divalent cation transport protein [Staphylococcus gallinarum]
MANERDSITLEDEQVYDKDLLDRLLHENQIDAFREEFLSMHNYEQSEYFEDSDDDIRQRIYEVLSPEEVADFFEQLEIDEEDYEALFDTMDATYCE